MVGVYQQWFIEPNRHGSGAFGVRKAECQGAEASQPALKCQSSDLGLTAKTGDRRSSQQSNPDLKEAIRTSQRLLFRHRNDSFGRNLLTA